MKLSDLKTGMVVKTEKYGFYLVLCTEKDTLFIRNEGYNNKICYEEDLTSIEFAEYNIVAVYTIKQGRSFKRILDKENLTLLWEREKPINYNTYVGKVCKFWDDEEKKENTTYIGIYKKYAPINTATNKENGYPHNSYGWAYANCELLTQEELKKLGITHD